MNKKLLFLAAAALCIGSFAQAQSVSKKTVKNKEFENAIHVNLLPVLFQSYNIFYDRSIKENFSMQLGFNHYRPFTFTGNSDQINNSLTLDFKIYFEDEKLQGFYIAPYLKYLNKNISNSYKYLDSNINGIIYPVYKDQRESVHLFGIGLITGYQRIFNSGIYLGEFIGVGKYVAYTIESYYKSEDNHDGELDFRLGINVGFAF